MSGELYIAAAGSGKTHKIVTDSLSTNKKVLILTYTLANERQIAGRIKREEGVIPEHITISTWFSFLLKEGIRPYQGSRFNKRIEGIVFINGQNKNFIKKTSNEYYISNNKIYTNRLSECVIELNEKCNGNVFKKISKIYDYIYIDEVQDLVGYDLEIIKKLIAANINVIMVGDPRQCTYTTHYSSKYKKYNYGKIGDFLNKECKNLKILVDDKTLNCTYRNNENICNFANQLFPKQTPVLFKRKSNDNTEGVMVIDKHNVDEYLKKNKAVQLRYNSKVNVNKNYSFYNFGESKGLEFNEVLIYPTQTMWNWIVDKNSELKMQSRAKLYVAITRAFNRVVIIKQDSRESGLPEVNI